ncbi:class I SAM-dependent methyltransferase [Laspinema olomoucense]|uniref:Class I SAM-dependent methyltransferase n=1 Tax=Laspinema olomoucense D3b TaxID=2953688 RepID=A0ABT2N1D3_9CYAN|nr:class I SAM-dependent methyltransferase [Laspinema sp. D3b]MCT7976493.1 class I SAM-dependent methyltransferase [Laspinema sp. D3b]
MNNELNYYENKDLWPKERYLKNDLELKRFMQCADMIPGCVTSLLDVGTGNGAFISYLETQNKPINYLGVERSKAAIECRVCKSDILRGSIDNLQFEDHSFDLVSALEVIEHLPYINYNKCLTEIERVAKNYILVAVPYREKRKNVKCFYCGCHFNPIYHMRSFDLEKNEELFKDFQVINYKIVTREVYAWSFLIGFNLSNIFIKKNVMPDYSLCPQCGFSGSLISSNINLQSSPPSLPAKPSYFKELLKSIWPKKEQEVWIITLHKRFKT